MGIRLVAWDTNTVEMLFLMHISIKGHVASLLYALGSLTTPCLHILCQSPPYTCPLAYYTLYTTILTYCACSLQVAGHSCKLSSSELTNEKQDDVMLLNVQCSHWSIQNFTIPVTDCQSIATCKAQYIILGNKM